MATIIATVTFAVSVPSSWRLLEGLPLFRNKTYFNVFIISDCLAFGLSWSSILLHFLASIVSGYSDSAANHALQFAVLSPFYSILAMVPLLKKRFFVAEKKYSKNVN